MNEGLKPCNCSVSTDISDSISCGTGKLNFNGFWEFPCTHGLAEYFEKKMSRNHGFTSVKGNTWCDVCGERADQHEPEGTFACPICGKESIHSHTSLEILRAAKAAPSRE